MFGIASLSRAVERFSCRAQTPVAGVRMTSRLPELWPKAALGDSLGQPVS